MSLFSRFIAEVIGTFFLALVVVLSFLFAMPFAASLMAAVTLGFSVYLLGSISGAHLNPAVTFGLYAVRKINFAEGFTYIVAQFAGAGLAAVTGRLMSGQFVLVTFTDSVPVILAEALGAFVLVLAVASVVYKQTPPAAAGLVIGLGLFIGIYMASPISNAILNPAVAVAIGSWGVMYILGPLVGGVCGASLYRFLLSASRVPARK